MTRPSLVNSAMNRASVCFQERNRALFSRSAVLRSFQGWCETGSLWGQNTRNSHSPLSGTFSEPPILVGKPLSFLVYFTAFAIWSCNSDDTNVVGWRSISCLRRVLRGTYGGFRASRNFMEVENRSRRAFRGSCLRARRQPCRRAIRVVFPCGESCLHEH